MRDSSPRAARMREPGIRRIPATRFRLATACCLALAALVTVPAVHPSLPGAPATADPAAVAGGIASTAPPAATGAPAATRAPAAAARATDPSRRARRPSPPPLAQRVPPDPAPLPAGDTAPSTTSAPRSLPPEALTGYVWPVRNARITTWFEHTDGGFVVLDVGRVHDGIDLATFCGDWVLAAHNGVVVYSGRQFDPHIGYNGSLDAFYAELKRRKLTLNALPIVVVIDDGNGYRSVYVHLRESFVKAGETVQAGQRIGREGATGHATGCHLHYSLVRMDGPFQAVAPELVEKWHYPRLLRERIDPMRVLSLEQDGAGTIVSGGDPPARSPTYGSEETLPHPRPTPRPERPDGPAPAPSAAPGTAASAAPTVPAALPSGAASAP